MAGQQSGTGGSHADAEIAKIVRAITSLQRAYFDSALMLLRGGVVLATATAICFRLHVNSEAVALIFLVILVVHSLTTGFREAAVLSVLAVLSLDFFFVGPLYSLRVNDAADSISLACFLITSLLVTRIQARMRMQQKEAQTQRTNLERLYRTAEHLLALSPEQSIGQDFLETVLATFHVDTICIFDGPLTQELRAGRHNIALTQRTRECYISGQEFVEASMNAVVTCLRARGRIIGAIGLAGMEAGIAAPALATLAATGLDRASVFRDACSAASKADAEILRSAILDALAHEFKTPLATIMTAAGGLSATGELNPDQTGLASLIESEGVRLADVTSRLLRLARLDREEVRPQMEATDLATLAQSVIDRYCRIWPDRQITLCQSHGVEEVTIDPELIQLTIGQLLDNACRYAKTGAAVKVTISGDAANVVLSVENEGSVIEPADHERIFERFYRGTAARQVATGSGLGLYVARKIAVAHSGMLALVHDDPSKVIFRLSLPVQTLESASAG